ncbi:hypothetical protein HK096_011562 [Nowakowskiella sp. JEL0078]|nr:hypothetical protein HK096_011562 [Nowakowskiella sp. JEL0078]
MVVGILKVTVVAARHLKDKDAVGKSDPCVQLYIDSKHKQQTKVVGGNLDPSFNETFTFAANGEDTLHVKVLDKDVLDSDTIGSAKVPLQEVAEKGNWEGWVPLPAWFGLTNTGEVLLQIHFSKT